jgi:hypothetical protein
MDAIKPRIQKNFTSFVRCVCQEVNESTSSEMLIRLTGGAEPHA